MFNSWDRQPIVHDGESGGPSGKYAIDAATHQLRRNFIMNKNWLGTTNSGYSVDWDDGSSQYNATGNLLVYGAFKVRDGISRRMTNNVIYGKPADYQCDGYNSTVFQHNTVISPKISFGCVGKAFGPIGSYNSVHQDFNKVRGTPW